MIEIHQQLGVSVVIPAFNEEENIARVINVAKDVREVDEVLVIDDGSKDHTADIAKQNRVKVISFERNMGKGCAMKKGYEHAKGDILIFIDADLKDVTPQKIQKIIEPFKKGYDFVKTRFARRKGRVTHLTAKPLLGLFFPEIEENFDQPLSGQIGIKKEIMRKIDLEDDMGADIGILIDVFEMGAKTKEIYFGKLTHDEKKLKDLKGMANAVSRVVLERAEKYHHIKSGIKKIKKRR